MLPQLDELAQLGFAVAPSVVAPGECAGLGRLFDESVERAGRRDGLRHRPVRSLLASPTIRDLVQLVLGMRAFAIRATLFDKNPAANWLVPWHQDVTIPVQLKCDLPGFEAWSIKGGVPYVRPPQSILESMLAVRIDLDCSTRLNGPLRVVPGSHRRGILGSNEIQKVVDGQTSVECHVPAGGALIMRPLLVHASSRALIPSRRRVLHLEFAAAALPSNLQWYDRAPLEDFV